MYCRLAMAALLLSTGLSSRVMAQMPTGSRISERRHIFGDQIKNRNLRLITGSFSRTSQIECSGSPVETKVEEFALVRTHSTSKRRAQVNLDFDSDGKISAILEIDGWGTFSFIGPARYRVIRNISGTANIILDEAIEMTGEVSAAWISERLSLPENVEARGQMKLRIPDGTSASLTTVNGEEVFTMFADGIPFTTYESYGTENKTCFANGTGSLQLWLK
jgi:hypothetical protein